MWLQLGCCGQSESGSDWGRTENKNRFDSVDSFEIVKYFNREPIKDTESTERILDS
jgi:hypothetical protein